MKKIKREKKLSLNKETLSNLKEVNGGALYQDRAMSGGPEICLVSDCSPCD
ncbi:MAG TPA: class I lanthipeptide [Thermoanaerobaculia bacterium]|nr:class I lanthipeptide [Thermoanaerobaculia bacterium]